MTNTIRIARARHKLSQAALAERVQVTRQTINAVESGRFNPSAVLALKLAAVLQVRIDDLFTLEEGDWD